MVSVIVILGFILSDSEYFVKGGIHTHKMSYKDSKSFSSWHLPYEGLQYFC